MLWFANNDLALKLILQSVYRFGFVPFNDAHRERYRRSILDRLDRFARAEESADALETVRAWVEVDEAVHSLVHRPLAHPQSAFARLGRSCRDMLPEIRALAAAAKLAVHVQTIAGSYADARKLTDGNDLEVDGTGAPGDVVYCNRLFLRLDGTAYPGRVVYRAH
jgi:hypothetical protein